MHIISDIESAWKKPKMSLWGQFKHGGFWWGEVAFHVSLLHVLCGTACGALLEVKESINICALN